jgi:hypothetical protein
MVNEVSTVPDESHIHPLWANAKRAESALIELSQSINRQIEDFQREHNVQVLAINHGWIDDPRKYPGQRWIQLFTVFDSKSPIHRS